MHEALGLRVRRRLGPHRDVDELARCIALHGKDRVNGEVDSEAVTVELHGDTVDEKRHVVGDDLDDGMRRLPAMLLQMRVVDPHLAAAGLAGFGEAEMGERRAVEVGHLALGDVGRCDITKVATHEGAGQRRVLAPELRLDLGDDSIDQLAFLFFRWQRHRLAPLLHSTSNHTRPDSKSIGGKKHQRPTRTWRLRSISAGAMNARKRPAP